MATQDIPTFWNDCFNIQLSILGILLTILTVILTIIISKKDELKIYSEEIKNGHHPPEILQRERYLINYIRHLRRANWKLMVVGFYTLIVFIFLWMYRLYFLQNSVFQSIAKCLIISEASLYLVCAALMAKWYISFMKK